MHSSRELKIKIHGSRELIIIMTKMTIIDPDIVYFRLSASAFCITYDRFNYYFALYVAINLTLFMIYIVSM